MRIISIQARYSSALSEIPDTSAPDAALAIESVVSLALLELLGAIEMDFVRVEDEAESASRLWEESRANARADAN